MIDIEVNQYPVVIEVVEQVVVIEVIESSETIETVSVSPVTVEVLVPGPQGPQGPSGSGGSTTVARVTPLSIGGHRIVHSSGVSNVALASSSDTVNSDNILGMTLIATIAGGTTQILTYGSVTEPSWAWTPLEPLFLSLNGLMSHTPPIAGVIIPLGFAENATTVFLDIGTPIYID